MGSPPGGPGREVEELAGRGSAYGAHTITHRQRQGEVFYVQNHSAYTFFYLSAVSIIPTNSIKVS